MRALLVLADVSPLLPHPRRFKPMQAPRRSVATGYASNIPRENLPPEPELLPEDVCMICKRRRAEAEGMCAACAKALASP